MYRKIGLFFLSLWLLFLSIIIITIDIPIYFGDNYKFVNLKELFLQNIVPFICILCLIIGIVSYFDFSFKIKGANQMPFKITKITDINYEHLTFLTTYIIPLVCFDFAKTRHLVVLLLLIIVICIIYIKTDLFYANPTLALLNYRIYNVDGEFKDGDRTNIILISREKLKLGQRCDYIKLDDRIYFVKLKK
ncbi:anti-phage protein KwaA [Capnocytophaga sputigena]|uniref:anti-phage protein KwaA n=1 Tax=Capnocytophaga sputigena TaxID=1019 RepID=UPI003C790DBD